MHYFILLIFGLKYLTNAEYDIGSWPVASKSTLIIRNIFLCEWS